MSAVVISFPLAERLAQVAASGGMLSHRIGGIRTPLGHCLQACAEAVQGDDVEIQPIVDLDRAVHDPSWDGADAALVTRQIRIALNWITDAQREAWVASTADGDDTVSTSWAADRALDLGGALARLESTLEFVNRRTRQAPCPPGSPVASIGVLDLTWLTE
ncbi:hypothetical protein [Lichenicola sp.]|uniref:hypothetical protein n=1 Tax=Lichenicola sp. TaxID=2804529 RepID=UPI003B0022C6